MEEKKFDLTKKSQKIQQHKTEKTPFVFQNSQLNIIRKSQIYISDISIQFQKTLNVFQKTL